MPSAIKVGLALGGGAARGLAHLGVLAAFEAHGIPIDVITGTSMGAIIGAMYAVDPDAMGVKGKIRAYLASDTFRNTRLDFSGEKAHSQEGEGIFYKFSHFIKKSMFYTLSMTKKAFISEEAFIRTLAGVIPDIAVEETRITFASVALNLHDGLEYVFDTGPLRTAVAASCALPGIIAPIHFEDKLLVDGGWIEAIPVRTAARLGAQVVIGVDISGDLRASREAGSSLDVAFKADKATRYALAREVVRSADFIIAPEVGTIHWADFSQVDAIIEQGRTAAEAALPGILKAIASRRKRGFWARLIGKQ